MRDPSMQRRLFYSHTLFDGADYQPERDDERLTGQIKRVFSVMQDGQWRTMGQIQRAIIDQHRRVDPLPSISAQLRHLRKVKWGSHNIERRHVGGGLYEYRLRGEEDE